MRSTEDPFVRPERDEALRAWAAARGVAVGAARQRLTYERLLARLDAALPLRFIVRGGRAIDLRFDGRSRPTLDLDVDVTEPALAGVSAIRQLLGEVCRCDLGDGWTFTLTSLQSSAVRGVGVVGFKARLSVRRNGQRCDEVSVDISRTRESTLAPEVIHVSEMLGTASMRVLVVPPETQIAEKVRAFTRHDGTINPAARQYDLVVAVALVLACATRLPLLRIAAVEAFARRNVSNPPLQLGAAPKEWRSAFAAYGAGYGLAGLPTEHGIAIISTVWGAAMRLPPPAGPTA